MICLDLVRNGRYEEIKDHIKGFTGSGEVDLEVEEQAGINTMLLEKCLNKLAPASGRWVFSPDKLRKALVDFAQFTADIPMLVKILQATGVTNSFVRV